jgi:alkylation response protein AidB-like acyl-CoA dehydrogenase
VNGGAYCLTEPGAGSDANSGKTKAVLSEDGKYYSITGQKMWISNAGFCSLFIVFARIEMIKYYWFHHKMMLTTEFQWVKKNTN